MSKISLRRFNIPLFIMTFVLLFSLLSVEKNTQVSATSSYTGETTANLNVRSDAIITSSSMGILAKGSEIQVILEKNNFAKINYGNTFGYISLDYVKKRTTPISDSFAGQSTIPNLPVRSSSSAYATKLGSISSGEVYQFTKHDNNWVKFNYNGKVGYVNKAYVAVYEKAPTTSTSTFKGFVNTDSLVVRSSASTYSTKLGNVFKNETYDFTEFDSQWYSFNFNGKTAYVYNKYITKGTTPIANLSTFKGYPTTNSLNVRSAKNTYSSVLGTLKSGVVYDFTDDGSVWYSVTINGTKGYVYNSYVAKGQPISVSSVPFYGYSNIPILNVRSTADVSSSKLGTIKEGELYEFKEHNDNWYSFNFNNKIGYVSKSYVTKTTRPLKVDNQVLGDFSEGEAVEALNIRQTPSFSATSLGVIRKGETIKFKKHDETWNYVEHNGEKGYVYNIHVKTLVEEIIVPPTAVEPQSPSVTKPTTPVNSGIYVVNTNSLNVRAQADALSTKVGSLTLNEKVDVRTQLPNGWSEISFNNSIAYVNSAYLKKQATSIVFEEYIVNTSSLNIRAQADALSAKIGSVTKDSIVKVKTKLANGWFVIDYNGKDGYINGAYVYAVNSTVNTTPSSSLKGKLIAIDAGHGGHDPGALGTNFHEKDFNLDVALRLKTKLESAGAKVLMIRSTDVYVVNSNRAYMANNANADLYLSIHANSSTSNSATGIDTFYYNSNNTRGNNSKILADLVQNTLISSTGEKNRGVKSEAFTVISLTKMPSILIELGFISNPVDHQKQGSSTYKNTLTNAIYSGINSYFK